jgi:hypothetical protein
MACAVARSTSQKKLLLGAVAEEVFRLAECPILSVGPEVRAETGKRAELQRLLYATNLKPHAERAASLACARLLTKQTFKSAHHQRISQLVIFLRFASPEFLRSFRRASRPVGIQLRARNHKLCLRGAV